MPEKSSRTFLRSRSLLDRIEFLVEEAIVALRRNGSMTISAINTAALALLIFGGLTFAYLSLRAHLSTLSEGFTLTFSIKPEAGDEGNQKISAMANELRQIEGVADVVFLPRQATWRKFAAEMGIDPTELPNPFHNQFALYLDDLSKADSIKNAVRAHRFFQPETEGPDIRDATAERRFTLALMGFVRIVGGLLTLLSFVTAGTIIYNTIRLTIVARRQELRTMMLVGASHGTIRWPLLLEGAIQGALGGLVAGILMWGIYAYIRSQTTEWFGPLLSAKAEFPAFQAILMLLLAGTVLGMLSAGLSARKYLRLGL